MNLNSLTNDELISNLNTRNDLTDLETMLADRLTGAMDALYDLQKEHAELVSAHSAAKQKLEDAANGI